MHPRKALFALILILACGAWAWQSEAQIGAAAQNAVAPCGVPIIMYPTPQMALATLHPQTGQPVILINPALPPKVGAAGMRWVLAHECAHHQLGQIVAKLHLMRTQPQSIPWFTIKGELAADYRSGQVLRQNNDWEAIKAGQA